MGASVQPEPQGAGDRISRNIAVMRAQGASEPDIESYLTQHEGLAPQSAAPTAPVKPPTSGPGWAAHVLNIAQGIPGVERLEAGAGAIGNGIPYAQSLAALRSVTGGIDPKVAAAERFGGSLVTLPFLPANPMVAGAALGGADQALSADQKSLGDRALGTAGGAAVGGVLGKVLDLGVTGVRSMFAKTPAANLLKREAAREAQGAVDYPKALAEGVGKPVPPRVQAFLAEPDIAKIVDGLQGTDAFKGVAPEDPRLIHKVYQVLSDQQAQIEKGLDVPDPSKANLGRVKLADVISKKQRLLSALSVPESVNTPSGIVNYQPMMPSYRGAVDNFATHSAGMDAVTTGAQALKTAKGGSPSIRSLLESTPEAFAQWAKLASPEERQAAAQGILGELKTSGRTTKFVIPSKALRQAPGLLRAVEPSGSLTAKLSLLGMNSP